MQALLFNFANSFLKIMTPAMTATADDPFADAPQWVQNIVEPIYNLLKGIIPVLLILVGTAGSIYAIVLGVNYSRAETSDKREEAKKRLVNAVVGLVVMILLMALLYMFIENVDSIMDWFDTLGGGDTGTGA